jgi:hypothetical protein
MKARSTFALAIVAVLGASGALAQVDSQAADPQDASATENAPRTETRSVATGGGRVVFIDPATRKIRQPDAAEIGRLVSPAPATARVRAPLTTLTGPGGAVGVLLDSRFDSLIVATKKPDGTLTMDCVTGDHAAAEALSSGAKAASTAAAQGTLDVR